MINESITDLDGEVWVSIFRQYSISNMGRVMSLKREQPIIMKTYPNNRGYHLVHFRIDGKRRALTVHKLVAQIFVKNLDPKRITVNHHFGKDDNRASSLSWMTYSENSTHGAENGLIARGSQSVLSKLDEAQARTIRSLKGEISQYKLANYFKVSRGTIDNIQSGKSWRHA